MNQTTKDFLNKLSCLMAEYEADFEMGSTGIEIGVVNTEEGYSEYVRTTGKYVTYNDIREMLTGD